MHNVKVTDKTQLMISYTYNCTINNLALKLAARKKRSSTRSSTVTVRLRPSTKSSAHMTAVLFMLRVHCATDCMLWRLRLLTHSNFRAVVHAISALNECCGCGLLCALKTYNVIIARKMLSGDGDARRRCDALVLISSDHRNKPTS